MQFLSDFIALHNKFYSLQPIRLCNGCAILQKEERKSLIFNDLRSSFYKIAQPLHKYGNDAIYELQKFLYVDNSKFRFIFQKAVYSALILKNRNSNK